MSSIVVDISELRSAYSEEIEKLQEFLKEKTNAKIDVSDREMTLKPAEKSETPSRDYMRVLLKKYLHKSELREEFRVISGKENMLIIKGRKLAEEE